MKRTLTLAGLLSLGLMTSTAQIQYTDLTPDSTSTGYLELDIDQDSYAETTFMVNGMNSSLFGVTISSDAEIAVNNLANSPNSSFASYLFSGFQLNSSYKWADYTRSKRLDDQTKLNFIGNGPSFIGFRMEDNGDYYYGWIMLELSNNLTLKVMSYAMETSANTPIVVGDTGANIISLDEQQTPALDVYPTVVTDYLNVEFSNALKTVEVVSLTGNVVYSAEISKTAGTHRVSMAEMPNGVYLVTLTEINGSRSIRKVVKQG